MTPHYENLTNPLINSSIENQNMPDTVRNSEITNENQDAMRFYYDQHSGISQQGIVGSYYDASRTGSQYVNSPS